MIPVTVAWLGGSVSIGTAPPLTGADLPASARDYRQGVRMGALDAADSGAQDGFLDCMSAQGYAVTLVERGMQGINASYLQTIQLPDLIADLAGMGRRADVLVVIHGGNDAKSPVYASSYGQRIFGPWFEQGPGSTDTSVIGQARAAWGPRLPVVISTLTNHNGGDLLAGLPENGPHHWHQRVRAQQLAGCDADPWCWPVETGLAEVPLAPDDHPTAEGYYNLGWMICQRMILDAL